MNYAIAPEKLYQIIDDDIQFIDLRDPYQFREQHLKNFQNIPYLQFFSQLPMLSQTKPIYLMCEMGTKAQYLSEELRKNGYDAYYIDGGFRGFLSIPPKKYY